MAFKSIVNKAQVNLSNCESEAIHIPGSIQPHGFLLALTKENGQVVYCSENTQEFLNISHREILGKSFAAVFSETEQISLELYLQTRENNLKPHIVHMDTVRFEMLAHESGDCFVLEFEPASENNLSLSDLYLQTRNFVSHLEKSEGLQELCQKIAEETRKIIGYDRVMIYRFDKDYNGEVFAESSRDDLEPFLGLNYPHTDIPSQARELYMKNLLRLISDVDYKPVPIYKLDDQTNDVLDLSMSTLRSVSPMHTEYLNNMGVGATLTISLMHDQKLWGLIACHHYSPRVISFHTRLAAQLQGNFLTSQIRVREVEEAHLLSMEIQKSLEDALIKTVSLTQEMYADILEDDSVLKLANASGVAVVMNGNILKSGVVPEDHEIMELNEWLSAFCQSGTYHSSSLAKDYKQASNFPATAAGIVYHTLGSSSGNCIIWFRPEVIETVNWAGDPNKSIEKNENGLSPRKSFELWKEIRKFTSVQWREPELLAASNFAYALQKQTYLLHLTEEEIKYKKLNDQLQKTNSELENMNWISTHDLREPLRKIQVFASMVLNGEQNDLSESNRKSIRKMSQSANRMQTLLNDIMAYSQVKEKQDAFVQIDLNAVLQELQMELQDEMKEQNAVMRVDPLPVIKGIKFQVDQLFVNLLRNSLKFSREGIDPEIHVTYEKANAFLSLDNETVQGDFHHISFADNGIGFSNAYSRSLFEIFKRLHTFDQYKGNGIGLAISRKIMENHGGFIVAEGKENEGATFHLYFPAGQSQD